MTKAEWAAQWAWNKLITADSDVKMLLVLLWVFNLTSIYLLQ